MGYEANVYCVALVEIGNVHERIFKLPILHPQKLLFVHWL